MLPELLSGLSLLLTTALIYLKDPDCMVGLRNAFEFPSLGDHAVHTQTVNIRTISRDEPSPSLQYFHLKENGQVKNNI